MVNYSCLASDLRGYDLERLSSMTNWHLSTTMLFASDDDIDVPMCLARADDEVAAFRRGRFEMFLR
jgi:hypothetical protein